MAIQPVDNSALLQTLLGAVTGGKTTTGGSGRSSSTTKTDISQEGILRIIENYLGSNGIADVRTGDARAGLGKSSMRTMGENDLLVRAAGEAARLSAPTTTTKDESTSGVTNKEAPTQNIDWGTLLGAGGVGVLSKIFGPTVSGGINQIPGANGNGLEGIGKSLADLILGQAGGGGADFFPQNPDVQTSPVTGGDAEGTEIPSTDLSTDYDYQDLSNWWDNFLETGFDMSD